MNPTQRRRFLSWIPMAVLVVAFAARGQSPGEPHRLWPGDAPGALGQEPRDIPEIVPWIPSGTGPFVAIVVCPGGGYAKLADHEGSGYAAWLQSNGIAAFVLKYRLGSNGYRHPAMLQDAARAVRTVRAHASRWSVDPARIGIMGSSAGGHLASTLLTHFDAGRAEAEDPIERLSSRPDFGVLCYAVISMAPPIGHEGSAKNLLGPDADLKMKEALSTHLKVTGDTPPTFLWSLNRDPVVGVENSAAFASALGANDVPFEFHVYQGDRHGTGLRNHPIDDEAGHPWGDALLRWIRLMFP